MAVSLRVMGLTPTPRSGSLIREFMLAFGNLHKQVASTLPMFEGGYSHFAVSESGTRPAWCVSRSSAVGRPSWPSALIVCSVKSALYQTVHLPSPTLTRSF